MLITLFYIFIVIVAVQLFYYTIVFSKFSFAKNQIITPKRIPISVIVCAKNEEENVIKFIPLLAEQNYPDFEIILIDDASSDATLDIFEAFEKQYSNVKLVKVVNNEAFWGNKKYALTLGIKAARNEHLLFTDADCCPVSKNWIYEMTRNFNSEKTIILGYGKYRKEKSLLNILVRFETLLTAIQYFSYAKIGAPYMAVGRNLAYHRSEFFKVKGFINHMHIKSGDDDLFIQDAANKKNTVITTSKDSFTESIAPNTFSEWFQQKRRHISTANHYKFTHRFFLGLFFLSKVLFYLLAIVLSFFYPIKVLLPLIVCYFVVQFIVIHRSSKKLNEPMISYVFPFLEIILLLFHFSIFITNLSSKPTHWK